MTRHVLRVLGIPVLVWEHDDPPDEPGDCTATPMGFVPRLCDDLPLAHRREDDE